MHRAKLAALVGVAALIVGVLPLAAVVNDWGTWSFSGKNTSWTGTFSDGHRVTGVNLGLRSLVKYNSVVSFSIGGKKCQTGNSHGTGACYPVNFLPGKLLSWKLTTRRNVPSSAGIVPCIRYAKSWHCRYGNG